MKHLQSCSIALAYRMPVLLAAAGRLDPARVAALASQDLAALAGAPALADGIRTKLADVGGLPAAADKAVMRDASYAVGWARVRSSSARALLDAAKHARCAPPIHPQGIAWLEAWASDDMEGLTTSSADEAACNAGAAHAATLPRLVAEGSPPLLARALGDPSGASTVALDFDGTLTRKDTTDFALAAVVKAVAARHGEGSEAVAAATEAGRLAIQGHGAAYKPHAAALAEQLTAAASAVDHDAEDAAEKLTAALRDHDAFDVGAIRAVELTGALRGCSHAALRQAGEDLAEAGVLVDGAREVVAALDAAPGIAVSVVSLSFGGEAMIGASLARPGLRVTAPVLDGAASDAGSSGAFAPCRGRNVHCAADKVWHLVRESGAGRGAMAASAAPTLTAARGCAPCVFVGDSLGDAKAVLAAAVGVLAVVPEPASHLGLALTAAGASLRPLLACAMEAACGRSAADCWRPEPADPAAPSQWPVHVPSHGRWPGTTTSREAALLEVLALAAGPQALLVACGAEAAAGSAGSPEVPPRVLIVAGSDSGGGAGIQADIKTVTALGAFAATAVTAVTAQNTRGVQGVFALPPGAVEAQMASVLPDLGADVIKTGMLPDADTVKAVADAVRAYSHEAGSATVGRAAGRDVGVQGPGSAAVRITELGAGGGGGAPSGDADDGRVPLVVDPVLVATSGHRLVDEPAMAAVREQLLPLALVCTPNLPEAEALLGRLVASGEAGGAPLSGDALVESMRVAALELAALGPRWVLIKGGHAARSGGAVLVSDVLAHGASGRAWAITAPMVATRNTHGTGCTLASAIAAGLAKGRPVLDAVLSARRYLAEALTRSAALSVGGGDHGPVNHAFALAPWNAGGPAAPAGPAAMTAALKPRPSAFSPDSLRLYAVTDPAFLEAQGHKLADAVKAAVQGGATMIQIRDKTAETGPFVAAVKEAVAAVKSLGAAFAVPVLVNDRIDVALAAGADGVHIGQSDMPLADVRAILGPSRIVGVTVATVEQAEAACRGGADYLGTNPVFETATKTDSEAIGVEGLAGIVRAAGRVPVIAIGGINGSNAAGVMRDSGAAGVAVVSAVFNQADPKAAAAALREAIDGAPPAAAAPAAPSDVAAPAPAPGAAPKHRFVVPPFAQACLDEAGESWAASYEHPFVLALADGSLDPSAFRFYQMQDARYLESFSDACAIIATRCPLPEDKLWFMRAGLVSLEVEKEMHLDYGKKLGYGPEDIASAELTPNAKAYADHMIQTATRGSLVEAVAALTPCPWLYTDLGTHLLEANGPVPDSHPYAAWLRLYADDSFDVFTEELLERMERFANDAGETSRARARTAFKMSARFEYMFWDQAWTAQGWPC